MVRAILYTLLIIFLYATFSNAAYVKILEPYNATLENNGTIYLGKVGPGQTFYVTISAATTNSSGTLLNFGWNKFVVSDLSENWIAANSSLNNPILSVKITVAPDAQTGKYKFNLTAINLGNYSKLGNLKFQAYVNVTPDVFGLYATPVDIRTGPGQPVSIYISINNTGVSDSPFLINVFGLPSWNRNLTVIALHNTADTFIYPVYQNEPGVYQMSVYVTSVSSPLIYKQINATLTVKASVPNDYAALGQGALAFPIIYEPVYAIMYLISLLFKH